MSRTEVTVQAFREFVEATTYRTRAHVERRGRAFQIDRGTGSKAFPGKHRSSQPCARTSDGPQCNRLAACSGVLRLGGWPAAN
jgi:formylglycine-generating enzyme required for sulfatase activity